MDISAIPDEALEPLAKAMDALPPERRGEVLTKAAAAVRRHAALLAEGKTPDPGAEKDIVGRTVFTALAKLAPQQAFAQDTGTRQTLAMLEKAVVAGARAALEKSAFGLGAGLVAGLARNRAASAVGAMRQGAMGAAAGAARMGGLAAGHAIYGSKAAVGAMRQGASRAMGAAADGIGSAAGAISRKTGIGGPAIRSQMRSAARASLADRKATFAQRAGDAADFAYRTARGRGGIKYKTDLGHDAGVRAARAQHASYRAQEPALAMETARYDAHRAAHSAARRSGNRMAGAIAGGGALGLGAAAYGMSRRNREG